MAKKNESRYYFVEDVMVMCEIKNSKAYKIISKLNKELEAMGKMTIVGRVPKSYFHLRIDVEVQEVNEKGRRVKVVV